MASKIDDVKILKEYLKGIFTRSMHHAHNVNEIIFPLIGLILLFSDGDIQVRDQDGELKNVLWFTINEKKYAMKYDHSLNSITLHSGSSTGPIVEKFQNSDSNQFLINIFNCL
jgi:hypothetical protein